MSAPLFGMALAWAVGLPAAVRGTLDVSDRTEVRVRDSGLETDPALDATNEPGFRLGLATRKSRWDLGYTARYTLLNLHRELKPTLLSEAYVRARWLASRRTQLTLTNDGSWGRQSFVGMAVVAASPSAGPNGAAAPPAGAASVPRIDAVPQVASIRYVSFTPSLTATTALSANWTLDTTVLHTVDGGFDREARAILPLKWGPGLEAKAEHLLSQKDRLVSTFAASRTVFSSGPETILLNAAEGIRRKITRRTDAELAVGVAAAWFRPISTAPNELTPYPTVTGVLNHKHLLKRDAILGIDVTVSLAPMIYRLTGYVAQRLQATAAVSFTENRLLLRMETGAAETLPRDDPQSIRVLYGNASVGYRFGQLVSMETGARYVLQDHLAFGPLPPQKVVYVGMTIREPTLRF